MPRSRSLLPYMTPDGRDHFLPEQHARVRIDGMLLAAAAVVRECKTVNLDLGTGGRCPGAGHQRRPGRLRAVVNDQAVGLVEAPRSRAECDGQGPVKDLVAALAQFTE